MYLKKLKNINLKLIVFKKKNIKTLFISFKTFLKIIIKNIY